MDVQTVDRAVVVVALTALGGDSTALEGDSTGEASEEILRTDPEVAEEEVLGAEKTSEAL